MSPDLAIAMVYTYIHCRPLQAGDELQAKAASGVAERRIELPPVADGPIRVVMGPQDDEFDDDAKALF